MIWLLRLPLPIDEVPSSFVNLGQSRYAFILVLCPLRISAGKQTTFAGALNAMLEGMRVLLFVCIHVQFSTTYKSCCSELTIGFIWSPGSGS